MRNRPLSYAASGLGLLILAGCGGGSGDDPAIASDAASPPPIATTPAPPAADATTPPPPATAASAFSKNAIWTVILPAAGEAVCFDFDSATENAACTGTTWDVKLTGGRAGSLATNSGPSGEGAGGAFGSPFTHTWDDLKQRSDALRDASGATIPPNLYTPDTAKNALSGDNSIGSAAFEYNLLGDNRLHPSYRTFLITTDASSADAMGTPQAPVYALQVTGYYGGATGTSSGYVSFQWIDRTAPANVRSATVDARSGWAYFDLGSGVVSSASGTWQIAFNRYRAKTNGGISGSGNVGGFVAATPVGLYDAAGEPITSAFEGATPALMQAGLSAPGLATPRSARQWQLDSVSSTLSPPFRGQFPQALDYGFYTYFPSAEAAAAGGLPAIAHMLRAEPTRGTLLRSGEGDSYARMRLAKIDYTNPADPSAPQTWTFEFDVQPAAQ